MPGQVILHLTLGFHDKAQADRIAGPAGGQSNGKSPGKPQRVQQAWAVLEFLQALLRPGQVIEFLLGGAQHVFAPFGRARHQGLGLIQRLGTDFTHMVDPHERSRFAALGFA